MDECILSGDKILSISSHKTKKTAAEIDLMLEHSREVRERIFLHLFTLI